MNYVKAAKWIFKLSEGTTGGHTRCSHCSCLVKNEYYEAHANSSKKCDSCGHPLRDHDMYL